MDLATAFEDIDPFLGRDDRIAVEVGGPLLELGEVLHRLEGNQRDRLVRDGGHAGGRDTARAYGRGGRPTCPARRPHRPGWLGWPKRSHRRLAPWPHYATCVGSGRTPRRGLPASGGR